MPDQHPGFLPHVTAGYGLTPDALEYAGPVQFNMLRLALGDEVTDYPLTGDKPDDVMPGSFAAKNKAKVTEAPPEADAEPPALNADNGIPVTFPVIIVEGLATSDGRFIEAGALSHRALPLPILAQTRNPEGGDGHAGADVIGRLDTLERVPGPSVVDKETGEPFPEGVFVWTGKGFIDPEAAGTKLAQKGYLTGNSADLSDVEAEFVWGDDESAQGPEQIRMKAGKIAATTLVPIPAFAQAYVTIDGEDMQPNETALAASASPAWVAAELGDDCFLCSAGIPAGFAAKKAEQVTAAAAVKSMLPPAHAFADPVLPGLTPLTLDEHSIPGYIEVTGHLAGWGTCHVGFAGQCVTPPKSRFDYGYFNVGAVRAHDAGEVKVVAAGHITMGEGGHAGMSLSADEAAAFYDNVNTVVADVAAGEDQFGIWVHGVVRRSATPEQVEALRASPLSGDWRSIDGSLELVAALAVNSGGFPIPRARVASGAPLALVAAGVVGRDESTVEPQITEAFVEKVAAALQDRYNREAQAGVLAAKGNALRDEFAADLRAGFFDDVDAIRASFLEDRREILLWELEFGASDTEVELAKKKNWVEKAGGLPKYIKRIAKHLQQKGMDESRAIATAVNAAKKMCSTGDVNFPGKQEVNPGSKAEACAAVADWEKKKAA